MVMAGTQATNASEKAGVEGDLVRGMLPRQIQTALKIQSACGNTINTTGEPRDERPTGVAIVSVLSDADHRAQLASLSTEDFRRAVHMATKGRQSMSGPLQPVLTDAQGRIQGMVVGEGINLFPVSTAKDGGGKSVCVRFRTNPRHAIDRQHELFDRSTPTSKTAPTPSSSHPSFPLAAPPLTPTSPSLRTNQRSSRGAYQYVTTTPQDQLSVANAVDATQLQTVVLMTCTNHGKAAADIPVVLIDMDEGAVKDFVDYEVMRLAMEKSCNLQTASGMDRSDVLVRMDEHAATIGRDTGCEVATLGQGNREVPVPRCLLVSRPEHESKPSHQLASGRSRGRPGYACRS